MTTSEPVRASDPQPAVDAPTTGTHVADAPASIAPDTKDWTWVLDQRCPECGFTAGDVAPGAIAATVRELVPRWVGALHRPGTWARSEPTTWSVLEYGAHVRDVHRVMLGRLDAMLVDDDPLFANWDQDATAIDDRYDLQDPATVAIELTAAAELIAARFDGVRPGEWERPGRRSNGSRFTVRTLGLYFLHDVIHHLHDVRA